MTREPASDAPGERRESGTDVSAETPHIGALHGDAWAGLVIAPEPGAGLAFRFCVRRDGAEADLGDLNALATAVGPWAADGRYARVGFDLELPWGQGDATPAVRLEGRATGLVVEWARVGDDAVVGRAELAASGELCLRAYLPWDWRGEWSLPAPGAAGAVWARGRTFGGHHVALAVTPDGPPLTGVALGAAVAPSRVERGGSESAPSMHADARPSTACCEARWDGPVRVEFAAAVAADPAGASRRSERLLTGVGAWLAAARAAYEAERPETDGAWVGLAAAVADTLHALVLVQPETGRLYSPAGRSWIFPRAPERGGGRDHWTLFGWDSYFNALELGLESPERARDALLAGLATACENGCVPNWRGRFGGSADRSQPPVGSLAALKLHLRTGDRSLLDETYGGLARWAAWWRADAGGRARRGALVPGLFSWGSDLESVDPYAPPWERDVSHRQLAAWESGQDDLPTWDEASFDEATRVLDLTPVDLNAYRVLDEECLGRMAELLGDGAAAADHHRRAEALRARMNEVLWDDDTGGYRDRLRDGSWAHCRAASQLLPLVAGVPDPERARRLARALEDPSLFGGGWPIPTVSRDDPHFPEQQYWRGTVWPPINYLVYQGLKRYGLDALAGDLAARSAELYLRAWRTTGLARENFDSRTGEGGGRRHQSWGPLLGLLALEELADVTPWDGLRVGGLRPPGPVRVRRLVLCGRRWDVAVGPEGLVAEGEGLPRITLDAPAVLRHIELDARGLSADVHLERPARLAAALRAGPLRARVDGVRTEVEGGGVPLAAGRHRIVLRSD